MKDATLFMRLSSDMKERMIAVAENNGQSVPELIRHMFVNYENSNNNDKEN